MSDKTVVVRPVSFSLSTFLLNYLVMSFAGREQEMPLFSPPPFLFTPDS